MRSRRLPLTVLLPGTDEPIQQTALVSSALIIRDGSVYFTATNNRQLAGALAAAVAWKTRNMFYTIIAGMITLFLLSTVTA